MVNKLFDKIEPTWRLLTNLDYGYWMVRFGESLESHEDHKGDAIPPPLANGVRISAEGKHMINLSLAAEGGDKFRMAELETFRPQADVLVEATVNWVVIKSVVENRTSIRENLPLEEKKEKKQVRASGAGSVKMPTKVRVTRSDLHSGTVFINIGRDAYASMYYVQYCQDNPTDENSWIDGVQGDSCRNLEISGLKPGEVYHFRVRCYGGGHYSPWSQIVTLRIL
ncbi:hypothetical protein GMST_04870 [Geomonas silvestris]|uniref:Fibronectin type-III domain-containing protein n=1 Tax=Geomonas silvestris TaxID=2740184 RepID=A0A6V8MDX5_9BACT|nr:fibronectin type III domain-containing protein [Geomonas silvestris]GFO58162.1 hypothetical protein GMST_04870 [Geomonas silvestris]